MKKLFLLIFLIIPVLTDCKKNPGGNREDLIRSVQNPLKVSGTRFIDSFGRQVILSGVNKVNKNKGMNYTDPDSLGSYMHLGEMGINVVRLGIIWDGIEPEPGRYDERYLDKVEERVAWAAQNGIYVLLDMHQDLYSVLYSDGAPAWATLTDSQPHATGSVWSDSYFMSGAVQKAFDSFWANKPAPDKVGLQDHYTAMWRHVAERFSENKAVVGYDIMNEPFNGSQGTFVLPQILTEYARMYAEETGKVLSQNEVMSVWGDENLRFEALSRMQDTVRYSRVLDVATTLSQQFEKETLQPFYQKVADAIREVDTTHILFIEHGYFGNTGIRSGIEPVLSKGGKKDPLVAYGAHGYDLLVDTRNYDSQSDERVGLIFSRIRQTGERMDVPVLVGEWGAFSGSSPSMARAAGHILSLFEKFSFSNTYWAYYNGAENDLYFSKSIIRPYPQYIGGRLEKYGFDRQTGIFSCTWVEDPGIQAPTVIYIPDIESIAKETISLSPERSNTVLQPVRNGRSGYFIIPVTGKALTRSVEFRINLNQDTIPIEQKQDANKK